MSDWLTKKKVFKTSIVFFKLCRRSKEYLSINNDFPCIWLSTDRRQLFTDPCIFCSSLETKGESRQIK